MSGISANTTGIKEIDRRLAELAGKEARKVVRAGVGAGLTVLAQEVRSQTQSADVSSRMRRSLLKTVGKRFAKAKAGVSKGTLQAKAGFSVGKKMKQAAKGRGRPGVGIDARNVHWALLGTGARETGSKKRGKSRVSTGNPVQNRGTMPAAPSIANAAARQERKVRDAIYITSRRKLEEVVTALNRK